VAYFFGRERMIDDVVERLMAVQLLVIHGSSGTGKSSLVSAGVQPRLGQMHARRGVQWRTSTIRPGKAPLANLARAFAGCHLDKSKDLNLSIARLINWGERSPRAIADALGVSPQNQVCVVLDQFEELFRFTQDFPQDEAVVFANFLSYFQRDPPPGMYILVTMRTDFLEY
jgi:hypothetical protein